MLASLPLAAQSEVSTAEKERIIAEINGAAAEVQTLQCDFVQTKTLSIMNDRLVSRGTMAFGRPSRLRWQYVSPYDYTFVITDDRVLIAKGSQRNSIDLRSSQAFQEIAKLIAGSVTGRCLSQSRDFDVTILADTRTYVARLKPRDRRLKKMFSTIRLTFDRQSKTMSRVELDEPGGDTTVIEMQNVRQNQRLSAKTFSLD